MTVTERVSDKSRIGPYYCFVIACCPFKVTVVIYINCILFIYIYIYLREREKDRGCQGSWVSVSGRLGGVQPLGAFLDHQDEYSGPSIAKRSLCSFPVTSLVGCQEGSFWGWGGSVRTWDSCVLCLLCRCVVAALFSSLVCVCM